ncbi:MAG: V-type ATP synthase subunit E [Candidatus Omnitrophica bacterium]|nr:V-type ATP synthase subunit E [Candidatus Omnitrophota bacterium]
MATELDSLIQKIKEEGVEEAKKSSRDIIADAERKAKEIIDGAQKKKTAIVEDGEREAANLKKSGEAALRQASRDSLLSLRREVIKLFDNITKREISQALSSKDLQGIIVKTIENFKKGEEINIEVLLDKKEKDALEKTLLQALKNDLKKGVTFKVSSSIKNGFRVGEKGKNFYYDFTDEAVAEAFSLYLNPKITKILKVKD